MMNAASFEHLNVFFCFVLWERKPRDKGKFSAPGIGVLEGAPMQSQDSCTVIETKFHLAVYHQCHDRHPISMTFKVSLQIHGFLIKYAPSETYTALL